MNKKKVFVIIGSASRNSANEALINNFASLTEAYFEIQIFKDLKMLPHFDPELSDINPPREIVDFRSMIKRSDAVLICTPEYVFSIPSGLKNAIEWCVSTTVFSEKPLGIITASANGEKGHQELQLIMKTIMSIFTKETALLIQGVKGKVDQGDRIAD